MAKPKQRLPSAATGDLCISGRPHEWRKGRCVRCNVEQPRHHDTAAATVDEAKAWLASLTPEERALIERCTCSLPRTYWHSFHEEGCPLAR